MLPGKNYKNNLWVGSSIVWPLEGDFDLDQKILINLLNWLKNALFSFLSKNLHPKNHYKLAKYLCRNKHTL